jgi:anti-anti-sigma factor
MRPLARIVEERHGEIAVAAIEGEIDASNTDELGAQLRRQLTNRSETLVVDLVATTYIDSAGINLLFALAAELHQRQQRLRLVVAESSPIARMIEIAGLATAVPAHPTRDGALVAASVPAP